MQTHAHVTHRNHPIDLFDSKLVGRSGIRAWNRLSFTPAMSSVDLNYLFRVQELNLPREILNAFLPTVHIYSSTGDLRRSLNFLECFSRMCLHQQIRCESEDTIY